MLLYMQKNPEMIVKESRTHNERKLVAIVVPSAPSISNMADQVE